jgi:hypothetical protein
MGMTADFNINTIMFPFSDPLDYEGSDFLSLDGEGVGDEVSLAINGRLFVDESLAFR